MKKLVCLPLVLVLVFGMFSTAAVAGSYPEKPVTIVCPYSAGGGSDLMVRVIANIIKEKDLMPKPVVVVNKTGGSGQIGKVYVLQSPADGYNLTMADIGNAISPILQPSIKWKTTDWAYLANMVYEFNVLCVKAGTFKELPALIEAAKKSPTPFTAGGTSTTGGPDSVCTVKLNKDAGVKIAYSAMKGGGEVLANVLGGHITMGWFNLSEAIGQLEAGKLVALGVSSEKRLKSFPDIPTFKELGYDVTYLQQRGLCMRADTPPAVVDYWIDVLQKVRATDEWQQGYLKMNHLEDGWMPGEEFKKWMIGQIDEFQSTMKLLKEMEK
ncbi:MAG: tripartite tricarboxylate transporter substrate binding protein [Desulfobacteraceae bacterium]|nr:MAG: tripartite tricarboxylate transporter substrate binding protein [Desulfobacteraceae bacterium]